MSGRMKLTTKQQEALMPKVAENERSSATLRADLERARQEIDRLTAERDRLWQRVSLLVHGFTTTPGVDPE